MVTSSPLTYLLWTMRVTSSSAGAAASSPEPSSKAGSSSSAGAPGAASSSSTDMSSGFSSQSLPGCVASESESESKAVCSASWATWTITRFLGGRGATRRNSNSSGKLPRSSSRARSAASRSARNRATSARRSADSPHVSDPQQRPVASHWSLLGRNVLARRSAPKRGPGGGRRCCCWGLRRSAKRGTGATVGGSRSGCRTPRSSSNSSSSCVGFTVAVRHRRGVALPRNEEPAAAATRTDVCARTPGAAAAGATGGRNGDSGHSGASAGWTATSSTAGAGAAVSSSDPRGVTARGGSAPASGAAPGTASGAPPPSAARIRVR